MKELDIDPALAAETLKKMTRTNSETGALKKLTEMLNSPEFSEKEDGTAGPLAPPPVDIDEGLVPIADPMPRVTTPLSAQPVTNPGARIAFPDKIFTTGRMKSGKDTFLTAVGCKIFGLADPLYALQKSFFGTDDKSALGARAFLQAAGQWGRGTINAQYPLTAARAIFVLAIRAAGPSGLMPREMKVSCEKYGKDENIWLDALIARMAADDIGGRIGVSNIRFQNEFDRLTAGNFTHFHVMVSSKTWSERLVKAGLDAKSPVVSDVSEAMAAKLDAGVLAQVRRQPKGPRLRVIWSDDAPSPSARFITQADIAASIQA